MGSSSWTSTTPARWWKPPPASVRYRPADRAEDFFARGVALEEDPTTAEEAISSYKQVLKLDPNYAPAHINLGTLYYNQSDYELAEEHYRKAIECDPRYALAYFDLGNVLDETQRLEEAIAAYKVALQLAPTYADAHYNLALAYERSRQPRLALKHWRAYLKLDGQGPWAVHARAQYKKLLECREAKSGLSPLVRVPSLSSVAPASETDTIASLSSLPSEAEDFP